MTAPEKPGLSNEELKPCPFCGGSAIFKRNEPGSESCKVICVPCLVVGPVRATRKAAIESWNRRAQSPPVAQVEVYRKALEEITHCGLLATEVEDLVANAAHVLEVAKEALLTSKPEPVAQGQEEREELADQAFSAGWYACANKLNILESFKAFKEGEFRYHAVVDLASADKAQDGKGERDEALLPR